MPLAALTNGAGGMQGTRADPLHPHCLTELLQAGGGRWSRSVPVDTWCECNEAARVKLGTPGCSQIISLGRACRRAEPGFRNACKQERRRQGFPKLPWDTGNPWWFFRIPLPLNPHALQPMICRCLSSTPACRAMKSCVCIGLLPEQGASFEESSSCSRTDRKASAGLPWAAPPHSRGFVFSQPPPSASPCFKG